jgi:hypothetical protein
MSKTHFIISLVERFFEKLAFSGKIAPNLVILGKHPRFSHSTIKTLYPGVGYRQSRVLSEDVVPVAALASLCTSPQD